jgi:hypothetical protein
MRAFQTNFIQKDGQKGDLECNMGSKLEWQLGIDSQT